MDSPLTLALTVSGIGLLTLFAALAFLYVLMYAMTAFIKDRPSVKQEEPVPAVEADESASPAARRAAVIAVALARAELEQSPAGPLPAEVGGSPWGQYHRRRLLDLNLRTRVTVRYPCEGFEEARSEHNSNLRKGEQLRTRTGR